MDNRDFNRAMYGKRPVAASQETPEQDSGLWEGTKDVFKAAGEGIKASAHGLTGKLARDVGDPNASNYANRKMIEAEKRRQDISKDFNTAQHLASGIIEAVPEIAAEAGLAYATQGRSLAGRTAAALGGQAVTYGKTTGDIYRDDLAKHMEQGGTAETYRPSAEVDRRADEAALVSTVAGAMPGMLPTGATRARRIAQNAASGAGASMAAQAASNYATDQDLTKDLGTAAVFGAGADLGLRALAKGGQKAVDLAKGADLSTVSPSLKATAGKVHDTLGIFTGGKQKSENWEAMKDKVAARQFDLTKERDAIKDAESDDDMGARISKHNEEVLKSQEYNFAEAFKEAQDEGFMATPGSVDVEYVDPKTGERRNFRDDFGFSSRDSRIAIQRSGRASPSMLRTQGAIDSAETADALREDNQRVVKRLTEEGLNKLTFGNSTIVKKEADALRAKMAKSLSPSAAEVQRLKDLDDLSSMFEKLHKDAGRHLGFSSIDIDKTTADTVADIEKLAYKTNMYDKLQDYKERSGESPVELLRDIQKMVYIDKMGVSQDRAVKFGTPDARKQAAQAGTNEGVNTLTAATMGGVPGMMANKLGNMVTLGGLNLKSQWDLRREKAKMERRAQDLRELAKRPAPRTPESEPAPVETPPVTPTADDKFEEELINGNLAGATEHVPEALADDGINSSVSDSSEAVMASAEAEWIDAERALAKAIGQDLRMEIINHLEKKAIAAKAKYDNLSAPYMSAEDMRGFISPSMTPSQVTTPEDEYTAPEQISEFAEGVSEMNAPVDEYVDPSSLRNLAHSDQIAANQARVDRIKSNRERIFEEERMAEEQAKEEEAVTKAREELARVQEELAKANEELQKAREGVLDAQDHQVSVDKDIETNKFKLAQKLAKDIVKPKKEGEKVTDEQMDRAVNEALKSVNFEFEKAPRVRDARVHTRPSGETGVGSRGGEHTGGDVREGAVSGARMSTDNADYRRAEAMALEGDDLVVGEIDAGDYEGPQVGDTKLEKPAKHDKWNKELSKAHYAKEIEEMVRKQEKAAAEARAAEIDAEEKLRAAEERQIATADYVKTLAKSRPEMGIDIEEDVVPEMPAGMDLTEPDESIDQRVMDTNRRSSLAASEDVIPEAPAGMDMSESDEAIDAKVMATNAKGAAGMMGSPLADLQARRDLAQVELEKAVISGDEAKMAEVEEEIQSLDKALGSDGMLGNPLSKLEEAREAAKARVEEAKSNDNLEEIKSAQEEVDAIDAEITLVKGASGMIGNPLKNLERNRAEAQRKLDEARASSKAREIEDAQAEVDAITREIEVVKGAEGLLGQPLKALQKAREEAAAKMSSSDPAEAANASASVEDLDKAIEVKKLGAEGLLGQPLAELAKARAKAEQIKSEAVEANNMADVNEADTVIEQIDSIIAIKAPVDFKATATPRATTKESPATESPLVEEPTIESPVEPRVAPGAEGLMGTPLEDLQSRRAQAKAEQAQAVDAGDEVKVAEVETEVKALDEAIVAKGAEGLMGTPLADLQARRDAAQAELNQAAVESDLDKVESVSEEIDAIDKAIAAKGAEGMVGTPKQDLEAKRQADAQAKAEADKPTQSEPQETTVTEAAPKEPAPGTAIDDRIDRLLPIPRRQRMETKVTPEDVEVEGDLAESMVDQQQLLNALETEKLSLQRKANELKLKGGYKELDEILRRNDLSIQTATTPEIKAAIKGQAEKKVAASREQAMRDTDAIRKTIAAENEADLIKNQTEQLAAFRDVLEATDSEMDQAFIDANALPGEKVNVRDVRKALSAIVANRPTEGAPEGFITKADATSDIIAIGERIGLTPAQATKVADAMMGSDREPNIAVKDLKPIIAAIHKEGDRVNREANVEQAEKDEVQRVNREATLLGNRLELSNPEIKAAIGAAGGERGQNFNLEKVRQALYAAHNTKLREQITPANHVERDSAKTGLHSIAGQMGFEKADEIDDVIRPFLGLDTDKTVSRANIDKAIKELDKVSKAEATPSQVKARIDRKTAAVNRTATSLSMRPEEISKAYILADAKMGTDFNEVAVQKAMLKVVSERPKGAPAGQVFKSEAMSFLRGLVESDTIPEKISKPILNKIKGLASQKFVKESDVMKAVEQLYKGAREENAIQEKAAKAANLVRKKNAAMEAFYKQHSVPGEVRKDAKAQIVTDDNGDYNIRELQRKVLELMPKGSAGYPREEARKNLIKKAVKYGLDETKAASLVNNAILKIPPSKGVDFEKFGTINETLFKASETDRKLAEAKAQALADKEAKAIEKEEQAISDLMTGYSVTDVNNLSHLSRENRAAFVKLLNQHNKALKEVKTEEGKKELQRILAEGKAAIEANQESIDQLKIDKDKIADTASLNEDKRQLTLLEDQENSLRSDMRSRGMSDAEVDSYFDDNSIFVDRLEAIPSSEFRGIRTAALKKADSLNEADDEAIESAREAGAEEVAKGKAKESEEAREHKAIEAEVEKYASQRDELEKILEPLGERASENFMGMVPKPSGRLWDDETFKGIKTQATALAGARKKAITEAPAAVEAMVQEAQAKNPKVPPEQETASVKRAVSQRDEVRKVLDQYSDLDSASKESFMDSTFGEDLKPLAKVEMTKVLENAKRVGDEAKTSANAAREEAATKEAVEIEERQRQAVEEAADNARTDAIEAADKMADVVEEIFNKAKVPELAGAFISKHFKAMLRGQDVTANAKEFAESQAKIQDEQVDAIVKDQLKGKTEEEATAYLNGLLDSLEQNMSAGADRLKALTKQFEAFKKAKDEAMADIPAEDSELADAYAEVLSKVAQRKEEFKDDPRMWLSWDDLSKIKSAFRKVKEHSAVHKSSNVGSLWKNLRAMTFGNTGDRVFFSESAIQDAISGKKPLSKGMLVKEDSEEGVEQLITSLGNISVRPKASASTRYRAGRSGKPSALDILKSRKSANDEGPDDTPPGGGGGGSPTPAPTPEPATPAKESPVGSTTQESAPSGALSESISVPSKADQMGFDFEEPPTSNLAPEIPEGTPSKTLVGEGPGYKDYFSRSKWSGFSDYEAITGNTDTKTGPDGVYDNSGKLLASYIPDGKGNNILRIYDKKVEDATPEPELRGPKRVMDDIKLHNIKGVNESGTRKIQAAARDSEQQKAVEAAGLDWKEFKQQHPKVEDRKEAVIKLYEENKYTLVPEAVKTEGALGEAAPEKQPYEVTSTDDLKGDEWDDYREMMDEGYEEEDALGIIEEARIQKLQNAGPEYDEIDEALSNGGIRLGRDTESSKPIGEQRIEREKQLLDDKVSNLSSAQRMELMKLSPENNPKTELGRLRNDLSFNEFQEQINSEVKYYLEDFKDVGEYTTKNAFVNNGNGERVFEVYKGDELVGSVKPEEYYLSGSRMPDSIRDLLLSEREKGILAKTAKDRKTPFKIAHTKGSQMRDPNTAGQLWDFGEEVLKKAKLNYNKDLKDWSGNKFSLVFDEKSKKSGDVVTFKAKWGNKILAEVVGVPYNREFKDKINYKVPEGDLNHTIMKK